MKVYSEKALMKSIEDGEWKSVIHVDAVKKKLMRAASETMRKDRRMNIRISKRDVEALKTKALEAGMPYQTLATSILHKYGTGQLIDSKTSP